MEAGLAGTTLELIGVDSSLEPNSPTIVDSLGAFIIDISSQGALNRVCEATQLLEPLLQETELKTMEYMPESDYRGCDVCGEEV